MTAQGAPDLERLELAGATVDGAVTDELTAGPDGRALLDVDLDGRLRCVRPWPESPAAPSPQSRSGVARRAVGAPCSRGRAGRDCGGSGRARAVA